jgi:hypothetical protein
MVAVVAQVVTAQATRMAEMVATQVTVEMLPLQVRLRFPDQALPLICSSRMELVVAQVVTAGTAEPCRLVQVMAALVALGEEAARKVRVVSSSSQRKERPALTSR